MSESTDTRPHYQIAADLRGAIERVTEFIAARERAQGLHPELIYGYNDHDLLMSDLRAVVIAAEAAS